MMLEIRGLVWVFEKKGNNAGFKEGFRHVARIAAE